MEHLFQALTADERRRVVILSDCMSAVPGFEAQARTFFDDARAQGARLMTAAEALAA
jgi:nicotinamidase-related amidase